MGTLSPTLHHGSHPSPSSPPPSQGNAPPGGPPGGMLGGPPGGMMGGPPDDINPKEFIVGILRNYSIGFKQALQPFMIDMIPENHKLQKSSEKLLKPKIIFRNSGEVAAFDSETGEELTMITADGVVDDAVYDKIFSEEFFKWFQDIHMKKEILIQKIKKLREEAKKGGKNITETVQTRNWDGAVHEKVSTFFADGTVHLSGVN